MTPRDHMDESLSALKDTIYYLNNAKHSHPKVNVELELEKLREIQGNLEDKYKQLFGVNP